MCVLSWFGVDDGHVCVSVVEGGFVEDVDSYGALLVSYFVPHRMFGWMFCPSVGEGCFSEDVIFVWSEGDAE